MRIFILLIFLFSLILADKDGNGKCWQREKIEQLQHIKKATEHTEYGSVILKKNGDDSDYYYFTPHIPSKIDLIITSNEPIGLQVGTSCKDASILKEDNDTEFVILNQEVKGTIYIHITAKSKKLSSYKIYVNLSLKDYNNTKTNYNNNYGSHFDCQLINGDVICKR
jgi:hypothetical protein